MESARVQYLRKSEQSEQMRLPIQSRVRMLSEETSNILPKFQLILQQITHKKPKLRPEREEFHSV